MSREIELATYVIRGANLLDKHSPGWYDNINVDRLHLADECLCILGQIYGNFFTGHNILALTGPQIIAHGFDLAGSQANTQDYQTLEAAWRRRIHSRRNA